MPRQEPRQGRQFCLLRVRAQLPIRLALEKGLEHLVGDVYFCRESVVEPVREPIPWRWRFFIVVTIIYVIWRIYQLVSWLSR